MDSSLGHCKRVSGHPPAYIFEGRMKWPLLSLFTLRMLNAYSTSCLDRAGSVQFVQEVQIMKLITACPTGALIDQKHVYN